ncbi:MAG: hypothetical protein QW292_09240 [Candidatus Parvarchaeota archaeon]
MITRHIPSYSRELNPDELAWDALKYQELPNFCPRRYEDLYSRAKMMLLKMKADLERMRLVIKGTKLPLHSTVGN